MNARYHVLISDDLIRGLRPRRWPRRRYYPKVPPCLRFIERGAPGPQPGSHWWLIEDSDAPAYLDGKRVELWFTKGPKDGPDVITERLLVSP